MKQNPEISMMVVRKGNERGRGEIEWLNSFYTFSFADYENPEWVSRGYIRVINEDYIQPGRGFDLHPHRDMEIITYIISGALQHHDSMGNGSIIKPGEIQRMSAGTGVRHSEFNASDRDELHLLQIWILPEKKGIEPSYEQKKISQTRNQLLLIGSPNPPPQAIKIHQNMELYVGYFDRGHSLSIPLNNHDVWLQLIKGQLKVNDTALQAGDGAWIKHEQVITFECQDNAEFLIFKMGD